MKCPDCTASIPEVPRADRVHYSWEYFENAAKYFRGLDRIHCTGGEPTLHPDFMDLAAKFRDLFKCRLLTIESNCFGFKRFPDVFAHFDTIYASHYTAKSFDGCPDNSEAIAFLKERYPGKVLVGEINFVPKASRGTKTCHRGYSETVAYARGLVFPCCVGPGLSYPHGVPLTESWLQDVLAQHIPCEHCWFAEH